MFERHCLRHASRDEALLQPPGPGGQIGPSLAQPVDLIADYEAHLTPGSSPQLIMVMPPLRVSIASAFTVVRTELTSTETSPSILIIMPLMVTPI